MSYSGPFVEVYQAGGPGSRVSKRKERYRQPVPYTLRLPYFMSVEQQKPISNPWGFTDDALAGLGKSTLASTAVAQARAYDEFKQNAHDAVNLAVNIAERKQAVDMIARRTAQVYRFCKSLSKLQFSQAARDLGLRVVKKKDSRHWVRMTLQGPVTLKNRKPIYTEVRLKKDLKSFGNNYLEYHFGWEPLMKDIGESINVLHSPVWSGLSKQCEGKGSEKTSAPPYPTMANFSISTVAYWPKVKVRLLADVVITDPNVFRLNQMGFVNPAVVLWELVPFSFIVDWFTNVGEVLEAYTDFVGVSLQNSSTTVLATFRSTTYYKGGIPPPGETSTAGYPRVVLPYASLEGTYMNRSLGISTPTLVIRPLKWPSVTRGLTAASLLAQFLRNQ